MPNEDRVFEYYRTIADGIGIPLVVQDHPASTAVHMSVALIAKIVAEIPRVACIKEEATPTPPKIRALRQAMKARSVPILTGLGALYGQFDLEAGSSGFNTGFAFPEVLDGHGSRRTRPATPRGSGTCTRASCRSSCSSSSPVWRYAKRSCACAALFQTSKVRHPGADLQPATAEQLHALIAQALPGADITRPLTL